MVRVAVAQIEPEFGDRAGNVDRSLAAIASAVGQGAEIIVLPELVSSGYMFASRAEAADLAEVAGAGPATTAWLEASAEYGVVIVGGFPERCGRALYNSAFMALPDQRGDDLSPMPARRPDRPASQAAPPSAGPGDRWLVYRKVHLWDCEALYFEPGNLGFPVVNTIHGRLGMMICYDGWFPESYRALVAGGVDIVCVPTNWVPIPGQLPDHPGMATILVQASAHVNAVAVAAADRVGTERVQEFIGQSLIAAPTGWPLAGPASPVDEALLVADVDVAAMRRSRSWGAFNHPLRDRRPDQYAAGQCSPGECSPGQDRSA